MTQSQLLNLAIEKAGSIKNLSEINDITITRIYEWRNGTAIRFETMIKLLKSVGVELVEKN